MSIIIQDITYINDQLFLENKKLRAQAEVDDELIKDLGKRLMKANKKIAKLEAELNELRMRQTSNPLGTSESPGNTDPVPGDVLELYRGIYRGRTCTGD
jgi:ABC-type phosphate transport system auxiliary subunit